ncbi:XRE family transcriptional regulator [Streptomyces radicis]|uniref:XRE family transcriptional regulator n=1 Tax=Streptomyces radicis TaxID=1750517 RepID=A0A3A9VSC1_9ACTN|nr:XRE family transcriptional regulator [Streptomyces radicis]RKN13887.1 XRE family transcriptional regulator [Streptomyces radicis]
MAEFLVAKRAALPPEAFPLPTRGARRVPGLRRDEVAQMSGISVDYYTRLEQGRERHPSPAVISGLARALSLTPDESAHLHLLCGVVPKERPAPERGLGDVLPRMLDSWPRTPAFVLDPLLDIVALNSLARALFSAFAHTRNLAEMTFLDEAGKAFHADWDRAAASCVAALRATRHLGDRARLAELLATLGEDARFAALWARYDVEPKTRERKVLVHDEVGELALDFQTFAIGGSPGHELVAYQAEPGSESERRLLALRRTR